MVYSVEELKRRIAPVAEKYGLREVYLFDFYARNEATEQSDVDILIDRAGSNIRGMFEMGSLYEDLCACLGKNVDLVTTQTLEQSSTQPAVAVTCTDHTGRENTADMTRRFKVSCKLVCSVQSSLYLINSNCKNGLQRHHWSPFLSAQKRHAICLIPSETSYAFRNRH